MPVFTPAPADFTPQPDDVISSTGRRRGLLLGALLLAATAGYGQQAGVPLISARLEGAPFTQLVQEIEARTPYRFYFEPAAVDTIRVTVRAEQQPLPQVLEAALARSGLHFAIDEQRRVFLTSGRPIVPGLADSYFQAAKPGSLAAAPPVTDDPLDGLNRPRQAASATRVQVVGPRGAGEPTGPVTISGHLRDQKTGEPVVGAAVFVQDPNVGTATNQAGYYSLTLPAGTHTLQVRGLGYQNTQRQVQLRGSGTLDLEVAAEVTSLKEVVIEAEKDRNVAGLQMGVDKLEMRTIRQVPTALGEADVLRVVLTLPGVKSVGEGSTGLNVRGGSVDQNLILFNGATIYNPSHLFGFFSAFNPDVVKSVELYKSALPARFGGRLSSVLDIVGREGNKKKWAGAGGVGPLTGRLTLEGPLVKDKTSLLVGGRTSYSDWLLRRLPNRSFQQSSARFYDLNAQLSHTIDEKNSLQISAYRSRDEFRLAADTTYRYLNQNASGQWNHVYNPQLYSVLTAAYSRYEYQIESEKNPVNASQLAYTLQQANAQLDFNYLYSPRHALEFGASTIFYHVAPGSLRPRGAESLVVPEVLQRERALESALYLSDRIELNHRLGLQLGLRYSLFNALGPREVPQYLPGEPRSEETQTGTRTYGAGRPLATYHGPEYRAALKYALTANSSVKASFTRTRQYLHLLTNTAAISPTDIWKLSDSYIRPQVGNQLALGYYHNFRHNTIETSVETYVKRTRDFVDYKSGATLVLNPHLETDVVNAEGQAYGVEVLVRKLSGALNGWISYTYSRSLVQVKNGPVDEQVNNGRRYPSSFDKPHDATLVGNYRFNQRFSTSLNVTYSTGRPITLPLAKYYVDNAARVVYSDRNAYRVPDYFRADIGLNLEGTHRIKKLAHSFWTLGVYNLTGRKNPYSVFYRTENGQIKGYQLSIFGQPIPTLTYNFKF